MKTAEKLAENNILIAEFMGYKSEKIGDTYRLWRENSDMLLNISELNYEKDWNKLMPVAEKCFSLISEIKHSETIKLIENNNHNDNTRDYMCLLIERMQWIMGTFSISTLHSICVEFISWHKVNDKAH